MKSLPFGKPGKWFRGNLHTHSTQSDGLKTPAQVCAQYRRRGYDFISLTDHFLEQYAWPVVDTKAYRTIGFTTIYGAELHAPKTTLGEDWHILAVGLPQDFAPTGKKETGPRLAQRARDAGAYVAVAHPAWYDLTDRDVLSIKAAHAIEIFNTSCLGHNGKGDSTGYLDRLLSQGHRYHAIATDDAHFNPDRIDHCRNWVMVRSRRLHPEALGSALRAGEFYSSQGPQIRDVKLTRSSKTLTIRTSPVRAIHISGRGAATSFLNATRDVTKAVLDVSWLDGTYGRITVVDNRGRKAWTNPFWLDAV
jgi:hypothetical protein